MGNSLLVVILVVSVFIASVVSVYFYSTNIPSNDHNILNNKLKNLRMKNDLDSAIVFDSMYNEGH